MSAASAVFEGAMSVRSAEGKAMSAAAALFGNTKPSIGIFFAGIIIGIVIIIIVQKKYNGGIF